MHFSGVRRRRKTCRVLFLSFAIACAVRFTFAFRAFYTFLLLLLLLYIKHEKMFFNNRAIERILIFAKKNKIYFTKSTCDVV